MSRISSVAYAFDDSGSLQNTGRASFFGSSVSPMRELLSGRPTISRLGSAVTCVTWPDNRVSGGINAFHTEPIRRAGSS